MESAKPIEAPSSPSPAPEWFERIPLIRMTPSYYAVRAVCFRVTRGDPMMRRTPRAQLKMGGAWLPYLRAIADMQESALSSPRAG